MLLVIRDYRSHVFSKHKLALIVSVVNECHKTDTSPRRRKTEHMRSRLNAPAGQDGAIAWHPCRAIHSESPAGLK